MKTSKPLVLDLSEVGAGDVELVGGKCASLGELFRALVPRGVRAVDGFATTSEAYRLLLKTDGLGERLRELMSGLDHNDIRALNDAGREARALMLDTPLPKEVNEAIIDAYRQTLPAPRPHTGSSSALVSDRRRSYLTLPSPDNKTRS